MIVMNCQIQPLRHGKKSQIFEGYRNGETTYVHCSSKDEQTKTPEYNHCVDQSTTIVKQPFEKFSETLKDSYTEYYELLNEEGAKEADKIIEKNARQAQEQSEQQIKLLAKIPEFRKKSD